MIKGDEFSLNQCPKLKLKKKEMKKFPYTLVIRSLIYVQVFTRPQITYIVGMLGRYLNNPSMNHWNVIK